MAKKYSELPAANPLTGTELVSVSQDNTTSDPTQKSRKVTLATIKAWIGGSFSFLDLSDTPSAYTGQAGKQLRVNAAENAVEFFNEPLMLVGAWNGVTTASVVIVRAPAAVAFSLAINFAGSKAVADVAATAQTDFDVQKNGSSVGMIRFAAGATTGTFIAASAVSFAVGDVLKVVGPATPDATLAGLGFTLLGAR